MDTMITTKVAAALCGSLLVFLLGKWVAEEIYHMDSHGEASYVIDTGAEEASEAAPEVSFEDLLASADIEKGAKAFKKCSACHKVEAGANGTGPYLYGVVDRPKGAAQGFGYSAAMAAMGSTWTPENLNTFLTKPSDYVKGTTMSFAGIKNPAERADIIAYLDSLDN